MPTMPRPSQKAKEIHRNAMPYRIMDDKEKMKDQAAKNKEMSFNIRQSMTR